MSRKKGPRFWRVVRVRYRRAMARIDRNTPEWMQWITPYGTSLTLHGVILLILGFAVYINSETPKAEQELDANFPQQLKEEELVTLKEADKAGDPFATQITQEPPSLALAPKEKDEVLAVPDVSTFKIASAFNTTPQVEAPSFAGVASGKKGAATGGGPMTSPFASRNALRKGTKTVIGMGGTVKSEKAVNSGLDWMARHQRSSDGGWSLDPSAQCTVAPGCPKTPAMTSDTAATGLALMPMLGAGHIHTEPGKYQKNVQRGLDWLISHQKPDGDLFIGGDGISRMYSHAIATMALCEAYGISQDEKLKVPAQKAIDFIIAARCKTGVGGWRYEPGQEGDTCVFGWQMFALRSAALSGLKVPNEVVQSCRDYLDKAAVDPFKSTYCYYPGQGEGGAKTVSLIMTAEGLLCRQYLGWHRDNPAMIQGATLVVEDLTKIANMTPEELASAGGRNIYYWYYATQLLHNMQGTAWQQWNVTVRDSLVALQVTTKGCDMGSWDPIRPLADTHGKSAGRHFVTSLSLLTLEVYYRYLPLYSERDRDVEAVRKSANPRGRSRDANATAAREKADKVDKEQTTKDKDKDKPVKPK